MEKFLGIFPRIGRNFSINMSENFLGIFPKLIPRNIQSKTTIFLRTNSELYGNFTRNKRGMHLEFFPWNDSVIFLDFFLRNFSYGKKLKFRRKDFDPSYLRLRWSQRPLKYPIQNV
jgi:hypothetical protein